MIEKCLAKEILSECLKTGADFAELYFEDTFKQNVRMVSLNVDSITTSNVYGCGIRILKDLQEIYGYTNDISKEGLLKLASKLANGYEGVRLNKEITFDEVRYNDIIKLNRKNSDVSLDEKIVLMKLANEATKNYSDKIIQAVTMLNETSQEVTIFNSNGVFVQDVRNQHRMFAVAIAKDENLMNQGSQQIGGNYSFDVFKEQDFTALGLEAAKQAMTMLYAPEMVGGNYTVVIHNGFGGVIFHEACGHSLEATGVAKGQSVFANKVGTKIASDIVTAIDDGTMEYEWGSLNIDDEGSVTKRNVLIENGILKGYMVDMRNGRRMKAPSTSNSRRQSYKYSPTSRMTNTFIENGSSTFEEIIAATKYGLFAKSMGGGSVNPTTGEFNFAVNEGYMIEDGKITTPVRGATLIGNGSSILHEIDMVGNNRSFGHGMCGSSSGSIPTNVGQPTIRVKNITVGGTGGNK